MSLEQKVTLYANVLNEADSIDQLLTSLINQTRPPDELIFIDGGSRDGTIERIMHFQESHANVKLVRYPGCSIAEGRNMGFSSASFDLVASIDGGCRAKNDWLENLLKEARPAIDIVSGSYLPDPQTRFERCVGDLMYPDIKSLPDDWDSPSHRSVLIRKRVWEALGGFPPYLVLSEDTWFNLEAARRGFKFKLARDAVVYWRPRRNLVEVFKSSFRWLMSDVKYRIGMERLHRRVFGRMLADVVAVFGWCVALATTIAISPLLGGLGLVVLTLLMIRPFRTVHYFHSEKSFRNKITKNLILLTLSAVLLLGYAVGILAHFRQKQLVATASGTKPP